MTGGRALGAHLTSLVVLSLWLGAALVVGAVVAPAAFAVLPTRTLAGALVGRVLPALFWSGAAVGLLVAMLGRDRGVSRRVAFGRLHMASVALLGVAGLAGVGALFFTVRAVTDGARQGITYPLHEP